MANTISTHNGNSSKVRRDHNIRNPKYVEKEPHIDPSRPHEIWHDETAPHAYRRIFGPSVQEYNARQKRPDRKIRNYHAEVKKSARKHDIYEMVAQVGSKDNAPDEKLGYKILREYADGWDERNPNLEAIGIYYHADEPGAPHVHIDYVPVAHGYTRGPGVQASLTKALREQGLVVSKEGTAQTQFIKRENGALEAICRHYGLDIVHPSIEAAKHLETALYKKQQAAMEAELAAAKAKEDLLRAVERFNQVQAETLAQEHRRDELERAVDKLSRKHDRLIGKLSSLRELAGRYERLRSHCDRYMSGGRSVLALFDEKEKGQHGRNGMQMQDRS